MKQSAHAIREAQERAERLNKHFFSPATIEGTPISIRIPNVFTNSYTEQSTDPVYGGKIDPRVLQPPFLQLPGYKITYVATHESDQGIVPYFVYVAAVEGGPQQASKLEEDIARQVRSQLAGVPVAWEAAECPTPEGTTFTCRRLRIVGPQLFLRDSKDAGVRLDATFDLYLVEHNGWLVLVGFRVPQAARENFDLETIPQLSVGTIAAAA